MTDKTKPEELNDNDLDGVKGGVGLLLPAVQQAREASRSTKPKKKTTTSSLTIDGDFGPATKAPSGQKFGINQDD